MAMIFSINQSFKQMPPPQKKQTNKNKQTKPNQTKPYITTIKQKT
jgi:hypothetical protein